MTLQEQFEQLMNERAELNKRFQEVAQGIFKSTTKEFFDKNPSITAVIWTQYTPFFNDGESCVFGVNEPYFTNANEEQMDDVTSYGEYEGEDEGVFSESEWVLCGDSEYTRSRRESMNLEGVDAQSIRAFSSMIQSADMEEVMEAMFGDHVRVVATRSGFDVEDHDHD